MYCATKDSIGCEKCESYKEGKCTNPLITNNGLGGCLDKETCDNVACPGNVNGYCNIKSLKELSHNVKVNIAGILLLRNLKTTFSIKLFKRLDECIESIPNFAEKLNSLIKSGTYLSLLDKEIAKSRKIILDNIGEIVKAKTQDEFNKIINDITENQTEVIINALKEKVLKE